MFSSNMIKAINPVIVKAEGEGNAPICLTLVWQDADIHFSLHSLCYSLSVRSGLCTKTMA